MDACINPSIHPSIHPPTHLPNPSTMAESKPSALTRSLTHNPRQHLEAWLIETETNHFSFLAICAPSTTLPAPSPSSPRMLSGNKCRSISPIRLDVAQDQPTVYRARFTWDLPAMHLSNASVAIVSIYRQDLQRNKDYAITESALLTVLLASIGGTNIDLLASSRSHVSCQSMGSLLAMTSPNSENPFL
jgi:hypothetical protein